MIWFNENNTFFISSVNFFENRYIDIYKKGGERGDILARGDWTFTYNNIDGADIDCHGNPLILKGVDEVNFEVENPEEGSSNAAVIATSSIFGLTLCAYFVYKKCMEMKQITDDFQRA